MQRWLRAQVFEATTTDLRAIVRLLQGRNEQPTGSVVDARTLRSTPESGHRAGNDPHRKTRGSKVHISVDTLGHLLAVVVTSAGVQDRHAVAALARATQEATGENVEVAYVDGAYRGHRRTKQERSMASVSRLSWSEAVKGFVLLPKRWFV